jgi:hypothetical protein
MNKETAIDASVEMVMVNGTPSRLRIHFDPTTVGLKMSKF